LNQFHFAHQPPGVLNQIAEEVKRLRTELYFLAASEENASA
jgi:hypothetical protein